MRPSRNVLAVLGVYSLMEGIGEIIIGSIISANRCYSYNYDTGYLDYDHYAWYGAVFIALGSIMVIAAICLLVGIYQVKPKFLTVYCSLMIFNCVNYIWLGVVLLVQNVCSMESFYGSYSLIWGGIVIFFVFNVIQYKKMMLNPPPRMPFFTTVAGYPQHATVMNPPLVLVNGSTQQPTVYSIPNGYPAPGIYPPPGNAQVYVNCAPNSSNPATGTYAAAGGYSVATSYPTA